MDWLLLFWALFVSAVYIGGAIRPQLIGYVTSNLAAVYAIILIVAACSWALRLRSRVTRN